MQCKNKILRFAQDDRNRGLSLTYYLSNQNAVLVFHIGLALCSKQRYNKVKATSINPVEPIFPSIICEANFRP